MTECEEIALSIWRSRSAAEGDGLNVTMPIRSFDDAKRVTRHYCGDQGGQIVDNVAAALYQIAKTKGR